MNRLIRSFLLGGTAAIALVTGSAQAHDVERARPPVAPVTAPAPRRIEHRDHDRDRLQMEREYRELAAARERFYRSWHGDRHARDRFERSYAARRAELDRHWAHPRSHG
jgi:hypothetical protein